MDIPKTAGFERLGFSLAGKILMVRRTENRLVRSLVHYFRWQSPGGRLLFLSGTFAPAIAVEQASSLPVRESPDQSHPEAGPRCGPNSGEETAHFPDDRHQGILPNSRTFKISRPSAAALDISILARHLPENSQSGHAILGSDIMARTARAGSNGISRGLTKRLYAPIFLLDILNDNLVDNDEGPSLNLHHASSQGSKEIFECFVNKLGQFCDVKKGGDTVTSVVILQDDTGVEYCFTSNQRTRSSFEASKRFLSDHILGVLGSTPDDHLDDTDRMSRVCSGMLRKVLAHSRWRIKAYIATLAQHIGFCIDICNGESAREGGCSPFFVFFHICSPSNKY